MRVLLTGATGFLGQHLVPYLDRAGFDTTLLVREAYGMGHALPPSLAHRRRHLQLVFADLRNFRLTSRALAEAEPDIVIHLASAGVTDPYLAVDRALRHNTVSTINLIRATFRHAPSTERLIVARTPGERGPTNAYQASKAAAWSFCHMYAHQKQWPIVGAMVFQTYGPGQPSRTLIPSALDAASKGSDFPMTSGAQQRDWIYVDDVMDALLTLVKSDIKPATTVDIGTGRSTSVLNVVRSIYDLIGRGGRPLPGALAERPGEDKRQIADATTTFERVGWRATVSLKDGLQRMLDRHP